MPPSKARAIPEDNRSEISSIREKASNHTVLALNGRTRRIAGGPVAETSTKDTVDSAAASASAVASVTGPGQEGNTGVWIQYQKATSSAPLADISIGTMAKS